MKRRYKMYGIVCNNISSLQKGIQFGKSIVEYATKYVSNDQYKKWASGDKQVMLYDGGSTNSRRFDGKYIGSMNRYLDELDKHKIEFVSFYQKDLGDQLTCICLLLDERIWDTEKFNDYDGPFIDKHGKDPSQIPYNYWRSKFGNNEEEINKIFLLKKFFKKLKIL